MSKKQTSTNRPTHRVYAVVNGEKSEKASWTAIGAVWPHKDQKGFNLRLDLIPISGAAIVVRAIEEKPQAEKTGE